MRQGIWAVLLLRAWFLLTRNSSVWGAVFMWFWVRLGRGFRYHDWFISTFFVSQRRKKKSCRHKVLTEKEVGLMLAHIGGMSTVLAATSFWELKNIFEGIFMFGCNFLQIQDELIEMLQVFYVWCGDFHQVAFECFSVHRGCKLGCFHWIFKIEPTFTEVSAETQWSVLLASVDPTLIVFR